MKRLRVHPRGVLAVAGTCFAALVATVVTLGVVPADTALREAILRLASPAVVETMRLVNRAGDWRVLAPGMLLMFVAFPEARRRWWLWSALMVAAPIMEWTLKHVVQRTRPEDLSLGFPSGHSTAAAAFWGAVIFLADSLSPRLCRATRVLAVTMIVLVGLARVVLRAHWPSDVLGGIALGLALAAIAGLIASRPPAAATEDVTA
jgi:membrane-associated phospholipid phosphatase